MSGAAARDHLLRAVELARRGAGRVEPNPRVGAVIVRGGRVVGEGWHRAYGGPHAEVEAIRAAGARARGATLFVTLEPCSRAGKTGPCTEAILAAGIRRVCAGAIDPHPDQRGRGLGELRRAGVIVERVGSVEACCLALNRYVPRFLSSPRPWVILKWALTLDGKVATQSGDARWISSESSRRAVHRLRGRVEAIVTGIGTVLRDDPLLTARPPGSVHALRVVLDSRLRIPPRSRLVRTAHEVPLLVATRVRRGAARARELERRGVEIRSVAATADGVSLAEVLRELRRRRSVSRVLLEAGPTLAGHAFRRGFADEVWAFWAPVLAGGGAAAPSALGGWGVARMARAPRVHPLRVRRSGGDVWFQGLLRKEDLPGEGPP